MNIFDHLVGQTIHSIKRRDDEIDNSLYCPVGFHLITNEKDNDFGLYIGILNDGISTDAAIINSNDLWERNGGEFPEGTIINELKNEDKLTKLIGERILKIRLAKYSKNEIKGETFSIIQGIYAGIELTTTNNKLSFYNNFGGCLSINEETRIPLANKWKWNE
jgi:hypothetical protein